MFQRTKPLAAALSCFLTLSAAPAFCAASDEKKDGTILAFTNKSKTHIEAAVVCDVITLKLKDGKTRKMSMRALNSKGASDATAMWNLFCFYVVKDIWRGVIHTHELMGEANISLEISSDGKHKVIRRAVYAPQCKPCVGAAAPLPPKAQEFWQKAQNCVDYIEFAQMKIPDNKVASVTLDVAYGRDRDLFPRYSFCNYQGLLKRINGAIVRAKAIK